jgi:hypothetical protein
MTSEAKMQRAFLGLATLALACVAADSAAAQQEPKDIIAAQLRSQGYTCDDPKSAARDAKASKPYGAVWLLTCENNTYRVTLIPNLAAQVELVDEGDKDTSAPR